jgi:hypothetical protein
MLIIEVLGAALSIDATRTEPLRSTLAASLRVYRRYCADLLPTIAHFLPRRAPIAPSLRSMPIIAARMAAGFVGIDRLTWVTGASTTAAMEKQGRPRPGRRRIWPLLMRVISLVRKQVIPLRRPSGNSNLRQPHSPQVDCLRSIGSFPRTQGRSVRRSGVKNGRSNQNGLQSGPGWAPPASPIITMDIADGMRMTRPSRWTRRPSPRRWRATQGP